MDVQEFTNAVRDPECTSAVLLQQAVQIFQEKPKGYFEALHLLAEARPEVHAALKAKIPFAEINTE